MKQSNGTLSFTVNADEYSWQLTFFQSLHHALTEAYNEEILNAEDNEDIEWKDDDAIIEHAMETGLLEKVLAQTKQKLLERDY